MGSSKSAYIYEMQYQKTILASETHSTLDCHPSWWINPTHSKKDREKGSNLWEKNTTNPALYCFIIPKISFSLLDTCNKSSNQKYPASLKHFSEIGLLGCEICYFDDDGSVTLTSGQADIVRDTKFLVEEGMHRHLKRRSGYRGNPQK